MKMLLFQNYKEILCNLKKNISKTNRLYFSVKQVSISKIQLNFSYHYEKRSIMRYAMRF